MARLFLVFVFGFFSACQAFAEDWPRFRGKNGSGVSTSTGLPTLFGPDKNLTWSVAVGVGTSSPVIARGRLFLTSADGDERTVTCLDARTGETLWKRSEQKLRDETATKPNGPATPTPVTDGDNVWVFFPDIGLRSYSAEGELQWRKELQPFHSMHGIANSLILAGGNVVLVVDQLKGSYAAAYNAETGKLAWKTDRLNGLTGGYSTPAVFNEHVIVSGPLEVVAYDAATGDRKWWVAGVTNAPVSLPVISENAVFVCEPVGEVVPISMFAGYDKNTDGRLALEEVQGDVAVFRLLERMDADWGNGDKVVDESEWNKSFSGMVGKGGLLAIDPHGSGDLSNDHVRWRYRKAVPYVPSILVYQDVLYFVQDGGILTSIDPDTGDVAKRARLRGAGRKYYASPVAADGKVFIVDTDGKVTVVKAGRTWQVLQVNELEQPCFATPAIADGRLYVRTARHLFCFGTDSVSAPSDSDG